MSDFILKLEEYLFEPIIDECIEGFFFDTKIPVGIGDNMVLSFNGDNVYPDFQVKVVDHYCRRLNELTYDEATVCGFSHIDLLEHTLRERYPMLKRQDYVYYYQFYLLI